MAFSSVSGSPGTKRIRKNVRVSRQMITTIPCRSLSRMVLSMMNNG